MAAALPFFLAWALLGKTTDLSKHEKKPKQPKVTIAPAEPTPPVPWPQVIPAGLPPFPGKGWLPDHPPSAGVVARAKQLRATLWQHGEGTHKIEQTNGRWIAYQASHHGAKHGQLVRGVNAYHLATDATVSPAPAAPVSLPLPPKPKPKPGKPKQTTTTPAPSAAPSPVATPAPVEPAAAAAVSQRKQIGARLVEKLAGVPKGKEDQGLVQAYENAAGIIETGSHPMYGPTVAYALAKDGLVPPSPLYWPKDWNKANKAIKDWKAFCAQQAALEPNDTRRLAWEESGRGARMQPVTPYSASNLQQAASIFFQ
jgi:hypothetical protein